jgi:hypothetical protein
MYEELQKQIILEVGEDEWNEKEIAASTLYILAQKFGLRVPVLTQSEVYLIHRESGFRKFNGKHYQKTTKDSRVRA